MNGEQKTSGGQNQQNETADEQTLHQLTAAAQPRENVYSGVYRALVVGMAISTPLFVIGVALALLHPDGRLLTPAALKAYYHPFYFCRQLIRLDPEAFLMLATLAMILTPVSRVVISLIAFAKDGDRHFVTITGLVLLIILLTLALGIFGVV